MALHLIMLDKILAVAPNRLGTEVLIWEGEVPAVGLREIFHNKGLMAVPLNPVNLSICKFFLKINFDILANYFPQYWQITTHKRFDTRKEALYFGVYFSEPVHFLNAVGIVINPGQVIFVQVALVK